MASCLHRVLCATSAGFLKILLLGRLVIDKAYNTGTVESKKIDTIKGLYGL